MALTGSSVLTISKQIRDLQKSDDLSLQAAYRNENVHIVRALIIGPPDTPYEFGFYEFNFKFPATYPQEPPKVRALTTNYGRTRFNPNIYANGKVCLSTLGTWRGERGESWSPVLGIESVLVSIQSLMSANPFENEPGFENYGKYHPGAVRYAAKVHHENVRIAVIQRLEGLLGISKESGPYVERAKEELRDPEKMIPSYGAAWWGSDHEDSSSGLLSAGAIGTSTISAPSNSDQAVPSQNAASKPKKTPSTLPNAKSPLPDTNKDRDDGGPAKKQKISPYEPLAGTDIYKSDHEFDPFSDVTKLRFLWYFDVYVKHTKERIKQKPGSEENIKPESKTKKSSAGDPKESSSDGSVEFTNPVKYTYDPDEYLDVHDYEAEMAEMGRANKIKPKPAVFFERMKFPVEAFEDESNMMDGRYCYTELLKRLEAIRVAIDKETASWALQGLDAEKSQKVIAGDIRRDFEQIKSQNEKSVYGSSFDVELVDNNPFVWQMTLFGKFTTNLEGAIIAVRICFSPNFPHEQPRVNVLTPLFHHRITKTGGVLCYVPNKSENISSHVVAIMEAIQDDDPRYDPRTKVNPEATDLLWGGDDKKKIYNRKVRRSVQDSLVAC